MKKLRYILPLAVVAMFTMGLREVNRQDVEKARNLMVNAGAESGLAAYTKTGSSTLAKETAAPLVGSTSLKWDASAATELLSGKAIAVPEGMKGQRCSAELRYKWTSGVKGDIKLQAYDGSNVLAEVELNPTTAAVPSQSDQVLYTCPASGNIQWRLEAQADAAEITVDQLHLGEPTRQVAVASAERYGSAAWAQDGDCQWSTTSTGVTDFPLDAGCTSPGPVLKGRVSVINGGEVPEINLDNAPPGVYVVNVTFQTSWANTNDSHHFRLTDKNDAVLDYSQMAMNSNSIAGRRRVPMQGEQTITTAADIGFKLRGFTGNASFPTSIDTNESSLIFTVYRFPLDTEKAISFDQADWRIDAEITSPSVSPVKSAITASPETEYTEDTMSLTLGNGSAPAEIACINGTAPEGLNCDGAAVDESIGIAFTPPYAGIFRVCSHGSIRYSQNSSAESQNFYRIAEVGLTDDTAVSAANTSTIYHSGQESIATAGVMVMTHETNVCHDMQFDSVSKKVVKFQARIPFGQTNHDSQALVSISTGSQRGWRWTVEPVTQFKGGIRFDNMVQTDRQAGTKSMYLFIEFNSGVPSIGFQSGDAVDSITDTGPGAPQIDWKSGFWKNTNYVCNCNPFDTEVRSCNVRSDGHSTSVQNLTIRNTTTGTPTDPATGRGIHVQCQGER